jgi:hypothetical protein
MNKDIVNETQKAEWSGFSPKVCVLDYLWPRSLLLCFSTWFSPLKGINCNRKNKESEGWKWWKQTCPIIMIFVDTKKFSHSSNCLSEERVSYAYYIYLYILTSIYEQVCVYAYVVCVLYSEKEKRRQHSGWRAFSCWI